MRLPVLLVILFPVLSCCQSTSKPPQGYQVVRNLDYVGKGNPRVYYNEIQRNETSNFSQLFVRLEPVDLPELEAVVSALRDSFRTTPDARIEVKQFEQGPPIEAPIAIRVFGEDLDSLRAAAGRVEELLKST